MKFENRKYFYTAIFFLITFIVWTALVSFVDVKPIGPQKSNVGFATLNGSFHNITTVNMMLYKVTDWLSIIPIIFVLGFALLGFIQLVKRKSVLKVDTSILILGGFFIVTLSLFVFFEVFIVNYRPILIEGVLEASTTLLVMCVMPTSLMQLNDRIKIRSLKRCVALAITSFTIFMVIGRLISGVHWLTDIIGGALLSTGLVLTYYSLTK